MRLLTAMCFLACGVLSRPAHAQAIDPVRVSPDCAARMAAIPGNRTTTIDVARLEPGNPMPALAASEPHRFTVSVVVDTVGRAEPATLKVPSGLDSATVDAVRAVLPVWRFSPARLSGCPIKQVVRLTFSR